MVFYRFFITEMLSKLLVVSIMGYSFTNTMAPRNADDRDVLEEEDTFEKLVPPQAGPWKYELVYRNLLILGYAHAAALYGAYLAFTTARWSTLIFQYVLLIVSEIGITAGAHRMWSHRSYKAKAPLQILLIIMNSVSYQGTAAYWTREHRMHHRYSDTDADPHNPSRGFFFSHIGWLLVRKHPMKRRGKFSNMDDINANPFIMFQKKYAVPLIGSVCFVIPTLIPTYFWGETLTTAWHLTLLRYALNLHAAFLVNSCAHLWGNKPYDKTLVPAQNLAVSITALGEGFHNFHHVFPWDYRSAELGNNYLNFTAKFIDFFAWIGWAYGLKTVPKEMARSRATKTGDGTNFWGL